MNRTNPAHCKIAEKLQLEFSGNCENIFCYLNLSKFKTFNICSYYQDIKVCRKAKTHIDVL